MPEGTDRSSDEIREQVATLRDRRDRLEERKSTLIGSTERLRDEIGQAVAHDRGDDDLRELRTELRDREDELDAVERGLEVLATDLDTLEEELATAEAREARLDAEQATAEAVREIGARAEELEDFLEEFVPRVETTFHRAEIAAEEEADAAQLAGERRPGSATVREEGWQAHPGLAHVLQELVSFHRGDIESLRTPSTADAPADTAEVA